MEAKEYLYSILDDYLYDDLEFCEDKTPSEIAEYIREAWMCDDEIDEDDAEELIELWENDKDIIAYREEIAEKCYDEYQESCREWEEYKRQREEDYWWVQGVR